jgi:putative hydrolase of HD superfamily
MPQGARATCPSSSGVDIIRPPLLPRNHSKNLTILIVCIVLVGLFGTTSSSFHCPRQQKRPHRSLLTIAAMSATTSTNSDEISGAANNNNSNENDNSSNDDHSVRNVIDFMTAARGLKTTPRTGWVRQGAGPRIESVADHSWRITLMAMVAASSSSSSTSTAVDPVKCIKMALVHDLAEATVGDITPHCGVSDDEKHAMELAAMTALTEKLVLGPPSNGGGDGPTIGQELLELWKEYERGTTEEAKLVKDMDKLEMTLQALEYEQDGKNEKSLDGFFDSTRGKWRTPIGEAWGTEIESRRKATRTATKRKVAEDVAEPPVEEHQETSDSKLLPAAVAESDQTAETT